MRKINAGAVVKIYLILAFFLSSPPQNSHALQTVYTIQAASFNTAAAAEKQFDSIVRGLNENELDGLRIEKIGKFYSVRLGIFQDQTAAGKFIKAVELQLSGAIILKAYVKDERIIRLYSGALSKDEDEAEKKSFSVTFPGKIKPRATDKTDKKKQIPAETHEKKGDAFIKIGHNFLAIEEYRQAVKQGVRDPNLFWKLSMLLYRSGFLDDAIVEMEKAVDLSTDRELLRIDLGVLYLAKGRAEEAGEQFIAALEINPSYAHVYYYLGEVFLRTEDYDMAWLSLKMARRLGNKGLDVIRKLDALSEEPDIDPWERDGGELYIRQIIVDTREKALDIVNRISEGELFENIAFKESIGPNAARGGYMGHLEPSEINPGIAEALPDRKILAEPVIVETRKVFHIVQRIIPFDLIYWKKIVSDHGRPGY